MNSPCTCGVSQQPAAIERRASRPPFGLSLVLLIAALAAAWPLLAQRRSQAALPTVRADMLVSTEWLARHQKDSSVVVLHVGRNRHDYDAGHIPGARFVAFSDLVVSRRNLSNEMPPVADLKRVFERAGVGDGTRVILYGDGLGLMAARAYFVLDYLGHGDRTALLDGGLEKWNSDHRPLTTETPAVAPASFTPRVHPELLVYLPDVANLSWEAVNDKSAAITLLDARPPAEYSGETARDGIARPGHIPGAVNLYWMDTLESKENPEILPPPDLRQLFVRAGVAGGRIVTYCVTGIQASHLYFTAKYLGYQVALYDGSFAEWSNAADTLVERQQPAK